MLTLQRASAGSGKTFTLAKKFLWYFLTVPAGKKRRLRTERELNDSLGHILAITFTNKATNEMKQRIVDKLVAIAEYDGTGKKPDYLGDFADDLEVPWEQISDTAKLALRTLLNDYGDFNVSTIDSFFQSVLRTFAYEADLNDSYQVELDNDYVSKVGVDGALEEIDRPDRVSDTEFWVNEVMNSIASRSSGSWNIFQKKESSFGQSSYKNLLDAVKKLENEEYKLIRSELERYFAEGSDFRILYEALSSKYDVSLHRDLERLRRRARKYMDEWKAHGLDIDKEGIRSLGTSMRKLSTLRFDRLHKAAEITEANIDSKNFIKAKVDDALRDSLREEAREIYNDKNGILAFMDTPQYRHWRIYRENLPYLGLMKAVSENRGEFLRDNNLIELSETSTMLRRIIGDDDAPFIYERLGGRLNHFLIDEFQDTSRLQWDNLRPLLGESLGRGNDNLIIGDAKQSIYRFRNADPSIINTRVPEDFKGSLDIRGMSKEENTNWRSSRRVVEFNNRYFTYLSSRMSSLSGQIDFKDLYSNVVQHPADADERGYIKVSFFDKPTQLREYISKNIGIIIAGLRERGYSMSDIAVLVNTNSEGSEIIKAIIDYNAALTDGSGAIEFISEESLKLASSQAVSLIVSALESIVSGSDPVVNEGEKRERSGAGFWSSLKCDFKFFAMQHPGMRREDQMELFLKGETSAESLKEMLSSMQTVALPALVESIVDTFVPEDLRKTEAAFISTFMDFVLDYCDRRDADVAGFLQLWTRQKERLSISTPEGADAVQVMTVHKAKGLEFKCVIVPYYTNSYREAELEKKKEWRWVRPVSLYEGLDMPPWMPVNTSFMLTGTAHADRYESFIDLKRMDNINSEYVAFTRAVNELYIFSSVKTKQRSAGENLLSGEPDSEIPQEVDDSSDGSYLYGWLRGYFNGSDGPDVVYEEHIAEDGPEVKTFSIGSPWVDTGDGKKEDDKKEGSRKKSEPIEGYYVNGDLDYLRYREAEASLLDEEDPDPRSEGNLMHAVMERVERTGDLPRAVTALRLKGLLSPEMADAVEAELALALADDRVAEWFDGSMKVLSERPILKKGERPWRPDRIMVDDFGNAVVVDYKFGQYRTDNRYRNQVSHYMELLEATGLFAEVRGYLWYVRELKIEKIGDLAKNR